MSKERFDLTVLFPCYALAATCFSSTPSSVFGSEEGNEFLLSRTHKKKKKKSQWEYGSIFGLCVVENVKKKKKKNYRLEMGGGVEQQFKEFSNVTYLYEKNCNKELEMHTVLCL